MGNVASAERWALFAASAVLGLLVIATTACTPGVASTPTDQAPELATHPSIAEHRTFDAGIVFTDAPRVICFPADELGIADASEVTAISTSCDCVVAEAVNFVNQRGASVAAIKYTFEEDLAPAEKGHGLLFETQLELVSGKQLSCSTKAILASGGSQPQGTED